MYFCSYNATFAGHSWRGGSPGESSVLGSKLRCQLWITQNMEPWAEIKVQSDDVLYTTMNLQPAVPNLRTLPWQMTYSPFRDATLPTVSLISLLSLHDKSMSHVPAPLFFTCLINSNKDISGCEALSFLQYMPLSQQAVKIFGLFLFEIN